MSVVRNLEITNDFYGITSAKGDIMVNNGIKNTRMPIGTNGYSLMANSAAPNGLEWAFIEGGGGGGGSGSIAYFQYLLGNVPYSTNYTSYVNIPDFDNTPETGNYVILFSTTYSLSKAGSFASFGLFKNGTLISNSSRNVETTSAGKRIAFYTQFTTTFSGTDIFSVRFHTNDTNSTATLYDGNLLLIKFTTSSQLNVVNSDFSTNATVPIEIPDMTSTPAIGVYLVMFNSIFETTKNNRTITFGLYKNDSLIAGTSREYGALPNTKTVVQLSIVTSFSGSELAKVKVNVSENNVDGIVYDRNILLIPLS